MLIDWFTVGAQALNFLVLVWLMKRFLYKPVLDASDAREKRIALALADAALKQAAAQKERDEFQKKNDDIDRQREQWLAQARDEARAERQRLIDEARTVAETLRAKKLEALTSELQALHQDIARRSREEVFAVAKKVLADLAGMTLEARMSEVFARRLGELDDAAKDGLARALKTASDPVRVRSTFELTAEQRAAIKRALDETFSDDIRIQFDTTPDLVAGIELTSNGWQLAWNIADYLASLEQSVDDLVREQSERQVRTVDPEAAR